MGKIIKFPINVGQAEQPELPENPNLDTDPNSMYEKLRLEYHKKYGWTTLGTFENWLRQNHYYDDLYTECWEQYKSMHHGKPEDNEGDYTNWIREELSKFYQDAKADYYGNGGK